MSQLKEGWEKVITEWFLPMYNWGRGTGFRWARKGDPNAGEPDALYEDEGTRERVWMEITTAYYDDTHAMAEWQKARGKSSEPYMLTKPDRVENQRLLDQVEERLRQKLQKPAGHYKVSEPVLLLVFTKSFRLHLGGRSIRERLEALVVPEIHPFQEIYIVSETPEVYQIFPERGMIA